MRETIQFHLFYEKLSEPFVFFLRGAPPQQAWQKCYAYAVLLFMHPGSYGVVESVLLVGQGFPVHFFFFFFLERPS